MYMANRLFINAAWGATFKAEGLTFLEWIISFKTLRQQEFPYQCQSEGRYSLKWQVRLFLNTALSSLAKCSSQNWTDNLYVPYAQVLSLWFFKWPNHHKFSENLRAWERTKEKMKNKQAKQKTTGQSFTLSIVIYVLSHQLSKNVQWWGYFSILNYVNFQNAIAYVSVYQVWLLANYCDERVTICSCCPDEESHWRQKTSCERSC